MQCDNCQRDAIYVYAPRMITPAHYCDRHLPTFLRGQTRSGVLQTTDAYDEVRGEVLAKLATKSEEPVQETVPEEAVEAAPEEPAVEEKPKRRRRPRKTETPPQDTEES